MIIKSYSWRFPRVSLEIWNYISTKSKKLVLSALFNSLDKFYIDRSTMMLKLTEDDILQYINDE